ncbi:MAG: AAA family ATPase, partial [Saprospiraceae bacterium]
DTIIIDEPELNLHPDSQRKVARFLGRLVNEGFKVIISTHSDYIIKELNNMIMLSSANGQQEDLLKRLGYSKNQLLKHNQVEAHLFTLANSKPEKIKIDETGFSVETIDEVIEQLDSDTEKIYYQLFEQENKT